MRLTRAADTRGRGWSMTLQRLEVDFDLSTSIFRCALELLGGLRAYWIAAQADLQVPARVHPECGRERARTVVPHVVGAEGGAYVEACE